MKNTIIFLIVGLFAVSCNPKQNESEGQVVLSPTSDTIATVPEHSHDAEVGEIALNNGAKWKSDESTTKNVNSLSKTVNDFKAANKAELSDYKKVGADLQSGVTNLIKECRMKGPDHDALHLWLEPLMGMVKELNASTDVNSAKEKFDQIDQQLARFTNSFE